jgi:hypothetical protein
MNNKFYPINYQYGYCSNPSDAQHRDAFPDIINYGNGYSECVPNLGLAPGLYKNPSLQTMQKINQNAVNIEDFKFLNGKYSPNGTSEFSPVEYSGPSLQQERPKEAYKNSWIDRAAYALNIQPDVLLSVFFSDVNIEHLVSVVVQKVKEITAESGVAGSKEGVTIMTPNMDDFFNYMLNSWYTYTVNNGSICFVGLKKSADVKSEIKKLNSSVLQDYISKMVSHINMYIYYYRDASQLPEQLSLPVLTSMKGSRSLEYNTGFNSGNSLGVASYNEVGNIM